MGSHTAAPRPPRALVFRLGDHVLAAREAPGRRIVEIDAWTRVPTAPPHLLGLANAQGKVLAVIDVRPLLGLRSTPWPRPLLAIVVGGDALRAAVAIEEVLGFEPFDPGGVAAPAGEAADGLRTFALGEVTVPPWRAVLIDLPAIVDVLKIRRPERLPAAPAAPPGGHHVQVLLEEERRWKLH